MEEIQELLKSGEFKAVAFTGYMSGDGESFCWDDVPTEDVKRIDAYFTRADHPTRLYPTTVLSSITNGDVVDDRRYQFVICARRID